MRFLFYLSILFLFSCTTTFNKTEKIYICGDHKCKNKKEINEYFSNNISIEVYSIEADTTNEKDFDLVDLNLLKEKLKTKDKIKISDKKKNLQKQVKERTKLAKLKLKKVEDVKKPVKIKKTTETIKKPKIKKKSQFTFVRICKNLEECDIDKISKIIMEIGREKDFPDLVN